MFSTLNVNKFIFIIGFLFCSNAGNLLAFPNLVEIPQSAIDTSLVHSAIQEAHNTGDTAMLAKILTLMPELIESRTKKREIKNFKSIENDNLYHVAWELGITPLEFAIRLNNFHLVNFLLEKGAAINSERSEYTGGLISPSYFSYTLLYPAIMNGNIEIVELMLSLGANPLEVLSLIVNSGWPHYAPIINIYSADKISSELNHSEMASIFENLDSSKYSRGLFSLGEINSYLKVDSITFSDIAFGNKILLSNGWTLYVEPEAIDLFSMDAFFQLAQVADQFLEIKKYWVEINLSIHHLSKVIGHALRLDDTSGEYIFVLEK